MRQHIIVRLVRVVARHLGNMLEEAGAELVKEDGPAAARAAYQCQVAADYVDRAGSAAEVFAPSRRRRHPDRADAEGDVDADVGADVGEDTIDAPPPRPSRDDIAAHPAAQAGQVAGAKARAAAFKGKGTQVAGGRRS